MSTVRTRSELKTRSVLLEIAEAVEAYEESPEATVRRRSRSPYPEGSPEHQLAVAAFVDGLTAAALICDHASDVRGVIAPARNGMKQVANLIRNTRDDGPALSRLIKASAPALLKRLHEQQEQQEAGTSEELQPVSRRRRVRA